MKVDKMDFITSDISLSKSLRRPRYWICCLVLFCSAAVPPGWSSQGTPKDIRGCHGNGEVCSACRCSRENSHVNCAGIDLNEVPRLLPTNLTILNLKRSNISDLHENSFSGCFRLRELVLSSNGVSRLPDGLFRDLSDSLLTLHLDNNSLELNSTATALRGLMNLRNLSLQKNPSVDHEVLRGLRTLEILHLNGSRGGKFGESFGSLESLSQLKIYPPQDNITNVTFEHLGNCTRLTVLDISHAGVRTLDRACFEPLKALTSLDLSNNKKLSLENFSSSLDSLPNRLEHLALTGLVGGYRPTLEVSREFVGRLGKKSLRSLRLNRNDFIYMDMTFSFALTHLQLLDISFNRFSNTLGLVGSGFVMVNLTHLIADNQSKRPELRGSDRKSLAGRGGGGRRGNLSGGRRRGRSRTPNKNRCETEELKPCKFPTSYGLTSGPWCIPTPRRLEVVHLTASVNNQIDEYPPTLFLGEFRVKEMTLGSNGLRFLRGPVVIERPNRDVPIRLDFSYNRLRCLAPNVFKESIKRGLVIEALNLEGNDLSIRLENDTDGLTFALYRNLTELNLADNKIKYLKPKSFHALVNLRTLNLSLNSLQIVEFHLSYMKSLRKLDLSNNLFVILDSAATKTLSGISSTMGYDWLGLYVRDNPFQCSCDALDFLYWMTGNGTLMVDLDEVKCLYDARLLLVVENLHLERTLRLNCYYSLPLQISGGLVALMIVCTLLGAVAYKYRWDIRYHLLKLSQRRRQYQLLMDRENGYLYDAFVSYDTKDRQWIVRELLPNLESAGPRQDSNSLWQETQLRNAANARNYGSIGCSSTEDNDEDYDDNHDDLPFSYITMPVKDDDEDDADGNSGDEVGAAYTDADDVKFKLCIHDRDFVPGNEIESNILSAIQRSRMVILVVTNHFLKSNWCRLELEMAKMESLERGRNVVITIFLEPIQETLESLEWLMKRYTYVEWYKCDTKSKRSEFWKVMKISLRSRQLSGKRRRKRRRAKQNAA